LVLDLDETLVHYEENNGEERINIRPNAELFLTTMERYYEIVIFTAGMQDYADWALTKLNQDTARRTISYRLYR
jgi:CTD small phosphatase-like protein 2